MKHKRILFLVVLTMLLVMCTSCTSANTITMPYSSEEYVNGEWTVDNLVKHFEDLGFTEVEVYGNLTEITYVLAENEDSLLDSFEKGEEIDSSRKIWIETGFETVSPLTVANCSEFAEFVENGIESPTAWTSFLEAHDGELLEFDGTITDWYDDLFWTSISFSISIEDSEQMSFSKSTIELIELGMTGKYHYNNYYAGLITEGMRVHVITEIAKTEDGWGLELVSIQVIE